MDSSKWIAKFDRLTRNKHFIVLVYFYYVFQWLQQTFLKVWLVKLLPNHPFRNQSIVAFLHLDQFKPFVPVITNINIFVMDVFYVLFLSGLLLWSVYKPIDLRLGMNSNIDLDLYGKIMGASIDLEIQNSIFWATANLFDQIFFHENVPVRFDVHAGFWAFGVLWIFRFFLPFQRRE